MLTHEKSTDLLDSTMAVLEGEPTTSPQSGSEIIDQWLTELHKAENATDIAGTLEEVKTQLAGSPVNAGELGKLLNTLATQTAEFSTMLGSEGDMSTRLEALASALKSLAGQLSHA